jgi:hypothetical protein
MTKLPKQLIRVQAFDDADAASLDELSRALNALDPALAINRYDPGSQANWMLPAAVLIIVAKPIWEGFAKEVGADGARSLKAALLRILRPKADIIHRWYSVADYDRIKALPQVTVSADDARAMLSQIGKPVWPLRIDLQIRAGVIGSFCFPDGMSNDVAALALASMPRVAKRMRDYLEGRAEAQRENEQLATTAPDEAFARELSNPELNSTRWVVAFDPSSGKWKTTVRSDRYRHPR